MRSVCLAIAVVSLASSSACGSRQHTDSAVVIEAAPLPSLMGPTEETARLFIEDMTAVLEANIDAPGAAVDRIEAFLRRNRESMLANAGELQARYAGFEPRTRRVYEGQFADYMQPAIERWTAVRQAFSGANPSEGRLIGDLIEDNDRN